MKHMHPVQYIVVAMATKYAAEGVVNDTNYYKKKFIHRNSQCITYRHCIRLISSCLSEAIDIMTIKPQPTAL